MIKKLIIFIKILIWQHINKRLNRNKFNNIIEINWLLLIFIKINSLKYIPVKKIKEIII